MYFARVSVPDGIPPYTLHQYLYSYFPCCPRTGERPFLFRHAQGQCLLLSKSAPHCPATEVRIDSGRAYAVDGVMVPALSKSQGFCHAGVGPKSKQQPIIGNSARRGYFSGIVERHGALVGFCQFFDMPKRQFRHSNGHLITFVPARVKAVVFVSDASLFSALLLKGVGRQKAFGNGLLYLPDAMRLPEAAHEAA